LNEHVFGEDSWREIIRALESKTKEINDRRRERREKQTPGSEAARWAVHVRRIVNEIALFVDGN
jgi:hypothetical protein